MKINCNTIKTELLKEDFKRLYNESKKFNSNMNLYNQERLYGYVNPERNTLITDIYFNKNVIGKYIPKENNSGKYSYNVFNGKVVDNVSCHSCHNFIIYNLDKTNCLSHKEYVYFVFMYNFIVNKLKKKYDLCKKFDTNGFEVSESDIAVNDKWMNKTTIAYLCYLMSLNLLIPRQQLLEKLEKTCDQDLTNYISTNFDVSNYSAYTRLNQIIEGYLFDTPALNDNLQKNIKESIKTYKPKFSIK